MSNQWLVMGQRTNPILAGATLALSSAKNHQLDTQLQSGFLL